MKKIFISSILSLCMAFSCFTLPVVQAKDVKTIDVTEFGADPSGKNDSTQAFAAALEAAKKVDGAVEIEFPYGEYRFDKDHATTKVIHTSNTSSRSYPEKKIAMLIEEANDLTIEGNGSTLLFYGDMMAIATIESENVKFHNFVLDYKDADTIDVSVVGTGLDANNKPYADIYVPAAYNYEIGADQKTITWQGEISAETGKPYWTWNNADFCAYLVVYKGYDRTVIRANNKQASNPFTGVNNIQPVSDTVVRFTYDEALPTDIVNGNIYQLSNSAWRQTAGAFFYESSNLSVENIDVHYLSGFGWLTQMCFNVEFKEVDFLPREGSGKYTTSNADQLHVAGCGGYFKVTDCNFSMAHDDPINVHGTYMRVEEVIDNQTLRVKYIHGQQGGFSGFHENDEVLFYTRTYLEPADGQVEDKPFVVASSIGPGQMYNGEKLDLVNEIITFKEPLPAATIADLNKTVTKNNEVQPLFVAENVTYTPEVLIKGNRMKSIPTRGILCTTRKPVIIEENIFDNMAMSSIYLSNDADDWYESGPIRNLTIRNNEFYIRPTGQNVVTCAGVFIEPITIPTWAMTGGVTSKKDPDSLVHKNITIEGNTFHMSDNNVVIANKVDGLTIKNNKVIHDDDSLAVKLNVPSEISLGQSVAVSATVTETPLNKDVFQLNECTNVTIEGNEFDNGMNLNVKCTKMDITDITCNDDELALRLTPNMNASVNKVQYIVSDENIASIDQNGMLVGHKAGEVQVVAYVEKNGTIISSEPVLVEVDPLIQPPFMLWAMDEHTTEKGAESIICASKPSKFEMYDALTNKKVKDLLPESDEYQTEVSYTVSENGIYYVKATTEANETAMILVAHSVPEAYGDASLMSSDLHIENAIEGSVSSKKQYALTIEPQANGNGIWQGTNYVNNVVNIDIPTDMRSDLILHVDVEGMLETGSGWSSGGIMLYTDFNNYFFAGKRSHMSGIATMLEKNGVCDERGSDASANKLTATTFEIKVSGTTATLSYIDANGAWQSVGTFDVSHITSGNMKLGFVAWDNGGVDFTPTYSNLRMAKASTTTREAMMSVAKVPFYQGKDAEIISLNTFPELSATTTQEVATVTLAPTTGVNQYVYAWYLGNKLHAVTTTNTFVPQIAGQYHVMVYGVSDAGVITTFTTSSRVNVARKLSGSKELTGLYINGNRLKDFNPNKFEYDFYLPAGVSSTFSVALLAENEGHITRFMDDSGSQSSTDTATPLVFKKTPKYITVSREEGKEYKINIHQVESNDASLNKLIVGEHQVNLDLDEIKDGTNSYFLDVDEDQFEVYAIAKKGKSTIKVTRSYFEHEVVDSNFETTFDVDMVAGINAYYIYVTAPDGITTKEYKLYLFNDNYSDDELTSIKLNGKEIADFDPEQEEYVIRVSDEEAASLNIEAFNKDNQLTSITYQNQRVEGTTRNVSLASGLNEVVITNQAKDIWSRKYYTLKLIAETKDNADLLDLNVEGLSDAAFDPDTLTYNVSNTTGKIKLSALTQVKEAKVTMSMDYTKQSIVGVNEAEYTFDLYEGLNVIRILVKAVDGTTQTYVVKVNARGLIYASDVIANGGLAGITNDQPNVGYGSIGLDVNVNGNAKIALPDEEGNKVVFEKGLGVHAASSVRFNLPLNHEFEKFEAYAGVDYVQYASNISTVTHQVWVDNVKVYDSSDVLGEPVKPHTPMQHVSVDIKGAKTVILVTTDAADGISYDHSVWADAIFTKPLPVNENAIYTPAKVENLVAKDTNYKTITLTWDASENATAYEVYRKAYDSEEFKLYKTVEDTTVAVTGVMTGKEYAFYVVAKNDSCAAEASETIAKATTLHGKVTLDIEPVSTSTFKLSWNKIDGATRYIVYRKRNDDKMKKVLTLGADKLDYVTAEMPNGDYQFILKAGRYDSKDRVMTDASNTVTGSVEKVAPAVTLKAATKSVKVSWKKVEGVTHYQVYRATSKDGKYTKLTTTKELSYTAKSLKSGNKYFFKVRGYKTYKSGEDIKYAVYTPYSTIKYATAK